MGVPIAIAYAALHPERVSHLILVDGFAKSTDALQSPGFQAERALRSLDWTIYTETFARAIIGYQDEFATAMTDYLRASVDEETNRAAWEAIEEWDVSESLLELRMPTLVAWNKTSRWVNVEVAQALAADIPGAQFILIDDITYQMQLPNVIREFVTS